MHGEYIIIYIMLDMLFLARYLYIKTQFYKTEGIAYGNSNHYFSEFLIRDDKGYNYVGWVSMNIFSPLHTRLLSRLCTFLPTQSQSGFVFAGSFSCRALSSSFLPVQGSTYTLLLFEP